LILKFPDKSIFKSDKLIKHFIRGYVDGDGSISYRNKTHSDINFQVLGTFEFLSEMQNQLPLKQTYKMFQKSHVNT
jgi:intein-encoded DNA endonuclease-like protein